MGHVDPRELTGRELARAYKGFLAFLPVIRPPKHRLAITEKGVELFSGTSYEAKLRKLVAAERDCMMRGQFKRLCAHLTPFPPPERVKFLETSKAVFAGTKYEKRVDNLLERERDAAGQASSQ